MRARRLFSLPVGPSEEGTRLWRSLFETEQALGAMLAKRSVPTERLEPVRALREAYIATRKLERYLRRCADRGVRPLVVGEAPDGRPEAFDGPSGDRMAAMLGVDRLNDLADAVNLLSDKEVEAGASVSLLRQRAALLPIKRRVVIACGRVIGAAFGVGEDVPFLAWRWRLGAAVLLVPDPSEDGRWWDDDENRANTERSLSWIGRRLKEALKQA